MQPGAPASYCWAWMRFRSSICCVIPTARNTASGPGAQVLIVTRSGTNQFHGSAYEFIRNNIFDARNFFDGNSVPGFTQNQFGAAFGGPLKADKTFFFTNFEGFHKNLHQTGVDLVPDTNMRNGFLPCNLITPAPVCPASGVAFVKVSPLINAWPAPSPGAPDFGGISEAFNNPLQIIRDNFGTVRLDHIFSPKGYASAWFTPSTTATTSRRSARTRTAPTPKTSASKC